MGMLGGIIGPTTELQAVTAAARSGSPYSSVVGGISKEPTALVSATADPFKPPNNMLIRILTW